MIINTNEKSPNKFQRQRMIIQILRQLFLMNSEATFLNEFKAESVNIEVLVSMKIAYFYLYLVFFKRRFIRIFNT